MWRIRSPRGFRAVALLGLLGLASLAVACQGDTTVLVGGTGQEGISVTGSGTVSVTPDVAIINLGVEVSRPTVARARAEAADAMEAIRESLADNGVEDRDIATQFFNIFPQFDFREEGPPTITGFTVSNQVQIKVREIDDVSDVLDDAIAAGGDAVRVNGISFTVDEPEQHFAEARRLAMEDARTRAEELAELADVRLGDVRSVSESFGGPIPFAEARFGLDQAVGGGPSPISPGETQISLTVFVVYEIG